MASKKCRLFAILALCLLFAGCGEKKEKNIQKISAPYSAKQMTLVMLSARRYAEEVYTDEIWDTATGEAGETYRTQYLKKLKRFFVEMAAMNQMADEEHIKFKSAEKKRLEESAAAFYDDSVRQVPELSGLTLEETENLFFQYARALKYKKNIAEDKNAEISQSEAKVVRIRKIAVNDRNDAELIRKRALEGEDFYRLAKYYAKGETIDCKIWRGELPEEVEAAAFSMDDGEISDVILAEGKYYVLKVVDGFDEGETEARRRILQADRRKDLTGRAFQRFMLGKHIEVDDAAWKQAEQAFESAYRGEDFFETVRKAVQDEGV